MKPINFYKVEEDSSIRDAIRKMDEGGIGFISVVEKNDIVKGIVTDGDFRRAVLNGIQLSEKVSKIYNLDFIRLNEDYSKTEAENVFRNTKVKHIPIIKTGKLLNILTEDDFFEIKNDYINVKDRIDLPVVIMAGGMGTRLDPLTRILPKALIPIDNKAMIEVIMDEYAKFGMKKFYISINHKGKMIRAYFEDHESDYSFKYITEVKPLGTAGALKFLKGKINTPFFVSNCDIIIKDDYIKIYDFHKNGEYALTLVASMQNHVIPYGVCEIENGGDLKSIIEKPQYDFLVNAGMYLLETSVLTFIPENEFFHITHLIEKLQEEGLKIGVYPVSEKSWIDVGQWREYNENLNFPKN